MAIVAGAPVASAGVAAETSAGLPTPALARIAIAAVLAAAVLAVLIKKRVLVLEREDGSMEALRRTPTAAWLCGAIGLWLAVYTVGPLLAMWFSAGPGTKPSPEAMAAWVYGVGFVACGLTLWLVGGVVPGRRFRAGWSDIGYGLAAFLVAAPMLVLAADAAVAAATLVSGRPPDPIAHETLERILADPAGSWLLIVGAVVGAPVLEETVYRGLLQTGLVRAIGRRWPAVVVTAAVFAGSHLMGSVVPWHALAPLFMIGLVCGVVAEKRGVVAAMVTHGAFNASQVVLAIVLVG